MSRDGTHLVDAGPAQRVSIANQAALRAERARTRSAVGADAGRQRLEALDAVEHGMAREPETYLVHLDVPHDHHRPVRAAIAVGDPDTATTVSVTVPGIGCSTAGSLPAMVTEAGNLKSTAERQLGRLGLTGSLAVIAWMGYEPPANPRDTGSLRDLWRTINSAHARAGGRDLAAQLQRIHVNNPEAIVTLLGHSYGSLVASLALQRLHAARLRPVTGAVFYGSPGLKITSAAQLGLGPGRAFVMRSPVDPITTKLAPLAPVHGWGLNPYGRRLALPELSSQAGISPDGVSRAGVPDHAGYARATTDPDGRPVLNMAGYNLAVAASGIAHRPGGGAHLVMAPTGRAARG